MTPTGSPPKSKQSRPRKRQGKSWMVVAAVLVAGAVAAQGFYGSFWSSDDEGQATQSETMQLFADQGPEGLLGLEPSAPGVSAEAAVQTATQAVANASTDAELSVQAQAAAIQEELDALLAGYGGLSAVPEDYLLGSDAADFIGSIYTGPFDIPDFGSSVPVTLPAFDGWTSLPSQIPEPGTLVPQQVDPLGAGTGELEGLMGDLEELLGTDELGAGLGPVEDLVGEGLPVPLPLDSGPEETGDAERIVEPHEDGAVAALEHATGFLGTADDVYGGMEAEATKVLDHHADLVAEVQSVIEGSGQLSAEAQQAVFEQLQSRTAEALEAHAAATAEAQAKADAYVADVQGTVATLEQDVRSHAEGEVDHIDQVVAQQQAYLLATAEEVRADADSRIAALHDQTEELALELQADGASSEDIAALVGQAKSLQAGIEAQVEADTTLLLQATEALQADAEEAIAGIQGEADATATFVAETGQTALQEVEARLAFALALADAERDQTVAALESGAQGALDAIQDAQAAHVDSVLAEAMEVSQKTEAKLVFAMDLVEAIQGEAYTEVGKDLDYIQEVAEDYAAVPVPEREARAEFWMTVHQDVTGGLGGIILSGDEVDSQLEDALALVQENLVGIQGF